MPAGAAAIRGGDPPPHGPLAHAEVFGCIADVCSAKVGVPARLDELGDHACARNAASVYNPETASDSELGVQNGGRGFVPAPLKLEEMTSLPKVLQDEVEAALDNASIDTSTVAIYRTALEGAGAVWLVPGDYASECPYILDASQVAEANSDAQRSLHRIVIDENTTDPPVFAAVPRHELEHARQFDANGMDGHLLYLQIRKALEYRADSLEGCGGMLINAFPCELDANAASAIYLSARHPEAVERIRRDPDRRQLVCSLVGPQSVDTLTARTVAFAYIHSDCCNQLAAANGRASFGDMLIPWLPDAAAMWSRMHAAL